MRPSTPPEPSDVAAEHREVEATLTGEIKRATERVLDLLTAAESVAATAGDVVGNIHGELEPKELLRCVHALRGLVHHGLLALVDVQREAGRLEALATVRQATVAWRDEPA